MQLRNGIDHTAAASSILLSLRLFSQLTILSISQSINAGSDCTKAPLCTTGPTKLGSLPFLQWLSLFLYCCSSCINQTFRTSFSKRTAIYSAFSAAIILNSIASFSLLNIRVLGLSATAPVFSITCLQYLIGSPHINYHPFSYSARFPAATTLAKIIVKSYI